MDISTTPVKTMTPDQIRAEARTLRYQITELQSSLSHGRAYAQVDKTDKSDNHLRWLAKTRSLLGKVQIRYASVRAAEKDLNGRQHRPKIREASEENFNVANHNR